MTRFLMLALISILLSLSGCASNKQAVLVGGIEDLIRIPANSIITNVPLPTTEQKNHDVVTTKNGLWISLDAWNRIEKGK